MKRDKSVAVGTKVQRIGPLMVDVILVVIFFWSDTTITKTVVSEAREVIDFTFQYRSRSVTKNGLQVGRRGRRFGAGTSGRSLCIQSVTNKERR